MTPTTRTFQPSPQQIAVFDWVRNGSGSLNLISYAGTGKTTTLMEIAKIIKGSGFCGAFNKAIADEFSERLRGQGSYHVKGATLHSAGLSAWRKTYNPQIDGQKVRKIARTCTPQAAWDKKLVSAICNAVSYAKQACLGVQGQMGFRVVKPWEDIIDYYDLRDEIPGGMASEVFIGLCASVYEVSLTLCEDTIDFDDMLLAPLYHRAPFSKFDWVMIDEAQDTNTARRLIAYAMMHDKTRLVAVGDPHQAIYGFAGASSDSMEIIKRDLGSSELPLSVTYRCPGKVVELAKTWVPGFTAHETAPVGTVRNIAHTEFWKTVRGVGGLDGAKDVILCRNTRPLVGIAGRLREMDIPCVVEGAGTRGLIALATKWGDDIEIDAFLEYLDTYEEKECAKHVEKGHEEKADAVADRCDTLRDLCRYRMVKTTMDLARKIEFLFGDTNASENVLRLCTIHRSKGREWSRVFLIGRNRYMPSPYAKKDWELKQEDNLAYVAVTRAKSELIEVRVPFKRKDGTEWWEREFVNAAEDGEREVYRDGGVEGEPGEQETDWSDLAENESRYAQGL